MISESPAWAALEQHATDNNFDLKTLLNDPVRTDAMFASLGESIHCDFSRQLMDQKTMAAMTDLAVTAELRVKIERMFSGEKVNETENRPAYHIALRAASPPAEVLQIQQRIKSFSERIRSEGKLTEVLCIGIGGSYLGPEFIFESLRTLYPQATRKLRFLANVDPIDVARALEGLDASKLLVIIISKTFTTAETMLNARTVRKYLIDSVGAQATENQMCAVSADLEKTRDFGISDENVFAFWDWVGGRFSGSSAVGLLPLSIHFGWDVCEQFLSGARTVDEHFLQEKNL